MGINAHPGWLDTIQRYISTSKAEIVTNHKILVTEKYLQKENCLNIVGLY